MCCHGQAARSEEAAEARRRRRAPQNSHGGTSLWGPRDSRGDQRPNWTTVELCRHRRAARRGGGVEPRQRTERCLGSGDTGGRQHRLRWAVPLERSNPLGWALHASESFFGDRGEAFGNAKARREPRRQTKRKLGADNATGGSAAVNAPCAPQQPPSMHAHRGRQGSRRGDPARTGGATTGPASLG